MPRTVIFEITNISTLDLLAEIVIREGIGVSALTVEFLLGQLDGAAMVGGLLGFSVVFSLLALVGWACHLFFQFRRVEEESEYQ